MLLDSIYWNGSAVILFPNRLFVTLGPSVIDFNSNCCCILTGIFKTFCSYWKGRIYQTEYIYIFIKMSSLSKISKNNIFKVMFANKILPNSFHETKIALIISFNPICKLHISFVEFIRNPWRCFVKSRRQRCCQFLTSFQFRLLALSGRFSTQSNFYFYLVNGCHFKMLGELKLIRCWHTRREPRKINFHIRFRNLYQYRR